ncbi:MAG: hypothetical protein RL199_34 [Pseudomonadota bacterium]|jgi:hypothetical protein
MISETTRLAEAELLAEVDRLRAEVERLRVALLDAVPKRWLTREQQLEATLRQHLAGVGQGAAK